MVLGEDQGAARLQRNRPEGDALAYEAFSRNAVAAHLSKRQSKGDFSLTPILLACSRARKQLKEGSSQEVVSSEFNWCSVKR